MWMEFTDEQRMLRETIRQLAEKEVAPLAYEIDRDERFPVESFNKLRDMGLLGITVPADYGGAGAGYTEMCIVTEELSAVCLSTAAAWGTHACLCIDNIRRNGNEAQLAKYLPPLCRGEWIGGLAMTEPSAGSDVMSMRLRAERRGDAYVLNGTKIFISNGPVGDVFVVYAKTAPERGAHGVTAFIVENAFPGFQRGKKFEKMGWRGSPTGELIFEDCVVPAENVLGGENRGALVLMSGLNTERVCLGAMSLGLARGAYECALKYAKERVQFGKPIASFQLIQAKLAEMAMLIELSRLITYKGAKMADMGLHREMNLTASYAKLFTARAAMKITTEAVQVLGGYGYMKEFPVERMMRDAKLQQIGGGTDEVQIMIIAREILALKDQV
ncbi:MAG TPA: acyl-CoA dehydrogenase family protein [Syntrophales bacterium]|nr:acyl-CoA dehydrogenase family protein [Syntrophales bacterium]HOM07052.1 acyl-CoA dehydrogenase family protein [Syntrophales bacterium]HON98911.1 acyl-CoA dehydrogenase family protein [Syntrophales bacterium]HPQ06579.1 acyl-CoA dehydrogenase family protein [Syntrophales bacterium]HRV42062.1 acyl-CoA dehydrogenase family protein [Syntrophales bacterium]